MKTERANAKINLYLNVVSRRENGYHNLESLMQTVSLCDLVSVDFRPAPHTSISLQASGNESMPTDCRNLAWRAAERYLEETAQTGEVRIFIEKHIPMAAGLAGGSADAAADVPFCIVGGTSLVRGIGEELTALPTMPDCPLVVACMGEGVSTPWAYGKLDELHGNFAALTPRDPRLDLVCDSLKNGEISTACAHFFNLFEEVVPKEQPFVDRLKDTMMTHGAMRAMMSGSGPSVFGVFADVEAAERTCEVLCSMGAAAFVCHPCEKYGNR